MTSIRGFGNQTSFSQAKRKLRAKNVSKMLTQAAKGLEDMAMIVIGFRENLQIIDSGVGTAAQKRCA